MTIEPIFKVFDEEAHIYPIGDIHLGSPQFNADRFNKLLEVIESDGKAAVILNGDLIENKNKYSQANSVMEQEMMPQKQAEKIVEFLTPIKDKIIGLTGGNHEFACEKQTGIDLNFWIASALDAPYRKNFAMYDLFVNDGVEHRLLSIHGTGGGSTVGAGLNRLDRFSAGFEDVDIFIMGHTHTPAISERTRYFFDGGDVVERKVKLYVHPSFMDYGGYAARGMLCPSGSMYFMIDLGYESLFKEVNLG